MQTIPSLLPHWAQSQTQKNLRLPWTQTQDWETEQNTFFYTCLAA